MPRPFKSRPSRKGRTTVIFFVWDVDRTQDGDDDARLLPEKRE